MYLHISKTINKLTAVQLTAITHLPKYTILKKQLTSL